MATGNDDGRPGEQPRGGPLDPDEQALLDGLRHNGGEQVVTAAAEDSAAMADAVDDDSVVRGTD
jgi:hypothetical protein